MLTAAVVFSLSALLHVSGKEAEKSVQKSKMEGSPFVWYLVQQVDKLQYEIKDLHKKMPLAENRNCSREVGELNAEIKNQWKLSKDLTAKVTKLEKELRKISRRKGYIGGSFYHRGSNYYKGGQANTLCLPKEPVYASYSAGKTDYSVMYGAECIDSRTSPNFNRLRFHDVPCAVCQTKEESVIMTPAHNECYRGWKVKYWGYLMSDHFGHTVNTSVWIEKRKRMVERKNGRFLYLVESRCGSLPCPPISTAMKSPVHVLYVLIN